jgi:hypothetical protein
MLVNFSLVSMRAIFLAHGPDFKKNLTIKSFENVNVYPLLCNLLQISCHPSNGTANLAETILINNAFRFAYYNSKLIGLAIVLSVFIF